MADAASTWTAFLRGINVGGRHKVPKADLEDAFVALGASEVRTYIQSGNVVFRAPDRVAQALPRRFEELALVRFGFQVPMVVRSRDQLRAVVDGNPFATGSPDERALHVLFLADAPAPAAIAGLDPDRSPPDAFTVHGNEVYLHLPNGMARTKLTNAYFDRVLATTTTARTWRTVRAVLELAEG